RPARGRRSGGGAARAAGGGGGRGSSAGRDREAGGDDDSDGGRNEQAWAHAPSSSRLADEHSATRLSQSESDNTGARAAAAQGVTGISGHRAGAQTSFEKICFVPEQGGGDAWPQARMTGAGQEQDLVRAAGREQRLGQAQGAGGEDVVVGQAVDEQQR